TSRDFLQAMRQQLEFRMLEQQIAQYPGTPRIDVARQTLRDLVQGSPPDIAISFLTFSACGPPRFFGRFEAPQRGALLGAIQGLRSNSSTALADALKALPQHLPGGDVAVNAVVLADGNDTCGGDPCAVARQLAGRYPNLSISVVGIGQSARRAACIAQATGGEYLEPANAGALLNSLRNATGAELPAHCR
ncbi:MAG: hypothetical protein LPK85_13660, partial [Gammaproteobacteria bacterium]|nr:hypothetical protein [Gammaproteobacteria bacterium]